MKKYIVTIASILFSLQSWGQIEYNGILSQAEAWYTSVTQAGSTSNQGNQKTIDFSEYNYSITGSFHKGQLSEGKIAEFYDTSHAMPELVLRGVVHYIANRTTVNGVMYTSSEYGTCCTYGTFIVSNSPNHLMVYKAKKADQLSITCHDVEYYTGYIYNNTTAVKVKGKPGIAVYVTGTAQSYNDYYAPLNEQAIKDYGYTNLTNLFMQSGNNARLHWSQGKYRDFKGTVIPEIKEDGTVNFILLNGEKSNSSYGHKTIKVYEDAGCLYMELNDDPKSQLKKEIILVKDKLSIDNQSYWELKTFLNNMYEVRWYYKNGDTFIGNATYEVKTANGGKSETITELITTGIYTYSNGDYFEGDLSHEFYCGFPVDGTFHFKDGTSINGSWLKDYDLTESQCNHIRTLRFPSDARNIAKGYYDDNLYQKLTEGAKEAKEEKRYEEAEELYRAAQKLRPDAEPWDEILSELKELIEEDSFRQEMISKYGDYYGPKVAECEIEIGMSKSMVVDAFSTDPVLTLIYKVSNKTDSANNVHEIWQYDYSQFEKSLKEGSGLEELAYKVLNKFGSSFGFDLEREFDRFVKYKYLDFKDDTLVDLKVTQRDELSDQIHDAMWLFNMVSRFF